MGEPQPLTSFEIEQAKLNARRVKRRRLVASNIIFVGGVIEGWVFGVPDAFRSSLDILLTRRVDKERTAAARKIRKKAKAVYRWVWTRGAKPLLSFAKGDLFYWPHEVRTTPWHLAAHERFRCLQINDAEPDGIRAGHVTFTHSEYLRGALISRTHLSCTQAAFEQILRTGELPTR